MIINHIETTDAAAPVRYTPAIETPEPDEAETTQGMIDALREIAETTFKDSGHALRGVHAKSHGLLRAQLYIEGSPRPELAQGLFAQPGNYPVVMRISTSASDILDDDATRPRDQGDRRRTRAPAGI